MVLYQLLELYCIKCGMVGSYMTNVVTVQIYGLTVAS